MSGRLLLVTGGARSGKSHFAQARAAILDRSVLFVATGVATDDEMVARIGRHRANRPPYWSTLEARLGIAARVLEQAAAYDCVLIEDLATLTSNLLVERSADEATILEEIEGLLQVWRGGTADYIVVTSEVGLGLVPATPLGRRFRDLLGIANQRVAAAADEVVLLVAGIPLRLKG